MIDVIEIASVKSHNFSAERAADPRHEESGVPRTEGEQQNHHGEIRLP